MGHLTRVFDNSPKWRFLVFWSVILLNSGSFDPSWRELHIALLFFQITVENVWKKYKKPEIITISGSFDPHILEQVVSLKVLKLPLSTIYPELLDQETSISQALLLARNYNKNYLKLDHQPDFNPDIVAKLIANATKLSLNNALRSRLQAMQNIMEADIQRQAPIAGWRSSVKEAR